MQVMMEDDYVIKLPTPEWNSKLTMTIVDLEKLRDKQLYWTIPPYIFFQLKTIFQYLETLGSARIEWNNTTLAEYVEQIIDNEDRSSRNDNAQELKNLNEAIEYIEANTSPTTKIDRRYISDLHILLTRNLLPPPKWEGSRNPWKLRDIHVWIKKSKHTPPEPEYLQDYFESFLNFINADYPPQNQLLMVATAHHRFAYIHPFDNWNWRMWRLLNYALLIKLWFQVWHKIINPSSVFYNDRNTYYDYLSKADSLKNEDLISWCEYFLLWLKNEIEKIDSLLDAWYVKTKLLIPTLSFALNNRYITDEEYKILHLLVNNKNIDLKSEELWKLWVSNSVTKSRIVARLRNKNMLIPTKKNWRIYTINFFNSYLLRWMIDSLKKNWFVSDFLNKN